MNQFKDVEQSKIMLDDVTRTRSDDTETLSTDKQRDDDLFHVGDAIDDYRVLSFLGKGASGNVYQVVHIHSKRQYALKITRQDMLKSPKSRNDFLREFQLAVNLEHEHLVRVYDIDFLEEGGQVYFTMELMNGGDLTRRLEQAIHSQNGINHGLVLGWMEHIAEALSYLHKEGFVHQDVKPANILLGPNDEVKLGDFGLAFVPVSSLKRGLKQSTKIGGTSYFMSPEQHQAIFYGMDVPITPASDVCAFGLSLFNMLSGEVIVGHRPPMQEFIKDSDLAHELDTFLDLCLDRKAERRFANGTDMLIAYRRIMALAADTGIFSAMETPAKQHVDIHRPTIPAGSTRSFQLTELVSLDMVWIPPGIFLMGSPSNEHGRSGDEHLHEVHLTRGFWMGITALTQSQWSTVMHDNPSYFNGRNHPVDMVSYHDAMTLLDRANESKGCKGFRLPTEAEWEYACRAGSLTAFAAEELAELGWFARNAKSATHKVATKHPNAWGLYDMHGNVWEWCADWYDDYTTDVMMDPKGPVRGTHRVARGGSWDYGEAMCRSATRNQYRPGNRNLNLGLRLVRDSD